MFTAALPPALTTPGSLTVAPQLLPFHHRLPLIVATGSKSVNASCGFVSLISNGRARARSLKAVESQQSHAWRIRGLARCLSVLLKVSIEVLVLPYVQEGDSLVLVVYFVGNQILVVLRWELLHPNIA